MSSSSTLAAKKSAGSKRRAVSGGGGGGGDGDGGKRRARERNMLRSLVAEQAQRMTSLERMLNEREHAHAELNARRDTLYVDPVLHVHFERSAAQLRLAHVKLNELRNDLRARTFDETTRDGQQMVAHLTKLVHENERLGARLGAEGELNALRSDVERRKTYARELAQFNDELGEFVVNFKAEVQRAGRAAEGTAAAPPPPTARSGSTAAAKTIDW